MKTTNSKKISAVIACVLSLTLIASGCQQTAEDTGSIPEIETTPAPETEVVSETTKEFRVRVANPLVSSFRIFVGCGRLTCIQVI